MERGFQERLVGAVVLVGLGVVVVPMFLDGPDESVRVSDELVLPAQSELLSHTIRLDETTGRPPEPAAAQLEAAPSPVEPGPLPEPARSAKRPATTPQPEPARAGETDPIGAWAVQVGSFASQANAEGLAGRLKAGGYPAFVARHGVDGKTFFRVRVGPEQDVERARSLAARLEADGHDVAVIRHP